MGVVMAEVRGSVDGKVVSEILKKEIERCNHPEIALFHFFCSYLIRTGSGANLYERGSRIT